MTYPVAFTDVIEGSGYDALIKQMVSRVDNLFSLKTQLISSSEEEGSPTQKRRLDSYVCLNWQPTGLPSEELPESQKREKEELKKKYRERCCDTKEYDEGHLLHSEKRHY